VTWEGSVRAGLDNQHVYPKTERGHIPTWIGVGGSPESVVRAARYGFPLVLAIIGGNPARFAPYVDLYRRALDQLEQPRLPVAVHSPGFIAETDEQAVEELWPHYEAIMTRIGRERGWPPLQRPDFEALRSPHGALVLGSPAEVTEKILYEHELFGHDRFLAQIGIGALPHDRIMRAIELFGTEVAPLVEREVAASEPRNAKAREPLAQFPGFDAE
jgi:alkanesulfonate monooxygenase SsuD/methylene tetrahydromethanopterin reductase-like flavin-dependent oxidoreductase (luciferase family)